MSGELVEVNCATIRGEQTMSTLFGHVKGAFTGAITSRAGLLKAADGGVLFLDEIGELGMDEQAMLLRAIEEKTFTPVGSDKPSRSDFQLIAGTNRDLSGEVAKGVFVKTCWRGSIYGLFSCLDCHSGATISIQTLILNCSGLPNPKGER